MENRSIKVKVVNPAEGPIKIGNDVIELNDHTSTIFKTNSIDDFRMYLKECDPDGETNDIYFNRSKIGAYPVNVSRQSEMAAVCSLETHQALKKLEEAEGKSMSREAFEDFLRYLARYGDESVLDLFSWVKNFQVKTITCIQRKKEPNGSFRLLISKEKAEKESYNPPEEITFTVPIFKFMEKEIKLSFEFYFDYTNHEDKVETGFKILNVSMEESIEEARKEAIVQEIGSMPNKKYWGEIFLSRKDDSWKYQKNPLT